MNNYREILQNILILRFVFSRSSQLIIPICGVTHLTREYTARIIPNAIGVTTLLKKYVFTSFISRERTYKVMLRVWGHSMFQMEERKVN
jgi:hypothetical protein